MEYLNQLPQYMPNPHFGEGVANVKRKVEKSVVYLKALGGFAILSIPQLICGDGGYDNYASFNVTPLTDICPGVIIESLNKHTYPSGEITVANAYATIGIPTHHACENQFSTLHYNYP
jgi:hypothetical protein